MRTQSSFKLSAIGLAVQAALLTLSITAYADDSEVQELIQPQSVMEVGVTNTSADSAKFGEYNGLNKQGASAISNIRLRGGDSYGMKDGVSRWSIEGSNLGTTSRSIGLSIGEQGAWSLQGGYDELRHVITDTYQTPYQGTMGGNKFTLPNSFGVINTSNGVVNLTTGSPYLNTDPQLQNTDSSTLLGTGVPFGTQALTASQKSAFQVMEIFSGRKNYNLTGTLQLDPQWGLKVEYGHLAQEGAKLTSAYTDKANALGLSGASSSLGTTSGIVVLPNPTNYTTDNVNVSANWKDQDSTFTAGYNISTFKNAVNGLTFSNPFLSWYDTAKSGSTANPTTSYYATGTTLSASNPFPMDTLSTAPSNTMSQFYLNGTHKISPVTRLAVGMSQSHTTQNMAYVSDQLMSPGTVPATNLNGLVVNSHYNAKLTHQYSKDLTLTAGYRLNDRDNRTSSNAYDFLAVNQIVGTAANYHAVNTPVSVRRSQFDVAGDLKLDALRSVRVSLEDDAVDRKCANALANLPSAPSGTQNQGVAAGYYTAGGVNSCVQVPHSRETKETVTYRARASEDLSYTVAYSHADRKSDVNADYYNPMKADSEGVNIAGYMAYFQASRKQDALKASVNWQVSEQLDLATSLKYGADRYGDSTFGVQKGSAWSFNLDGTYNFNDESSVTGYYTFQNRQRQMLNAQSWNAATNAYSANISTNTWFNNLRDTDATVGVNVKRGGLMENKLKLSGDLSTTYAVSGYKTGAADGSTYVCVSTTASGITSGLNCGATPDISTRVLRLRLGAEYALDKNTKLNFVALHQRLVSDDPYFNFYQYGYTATSALPTNQQSGTYSVNTIATSFVHNF